MTIDIITGRLEGWCQDNDYDYIIWGYLYDDIKKRWREGVRIHTSYVVTPSEEWKEGAVVKTRNSTYLLGKPYKKSPVVRPVDPAIIASLARTEEAFCGLLDID